MNYHGTYWIHVGQMVDLNSVTNLWFHKVQGTSPVLVSKVRPCSMGIVIPSSLAFMYSFRKQIVLIGNYELQTTINMGNEMTANKFYTSIPATLLLFLLLLLQHNPGWVLAFSTRLFHSA
jgi:hypothetical protein